jgi:hypothetical protein
MKLIMNIIKWLLFFLVLIIQAGAFLEGELIAGTTGAIFCLVLTLNKDFIENKYKVKKIYIDFLFFFIFIFGSWVDMSLYQ